jgi:hypothetical protein
VSASRPGRSLPPGKTRYPLYRRLGRPQGRSGQKRKIAPPPGFDPRTVEPVASRCTDYETRPTVCLYQKKEEEPGDLPYVLDNVTYWTQKYLQVVFLLVFKYLMQVTTVCYGTTPRRLILFNKIANRVLRDVRHGLQGVLCFQTAMHTSM